MMVACLQLGAADYMIKPLRHNELRNLWARVYWWRRVSRLPAPFLTCSAMGQLAPRCGQWLAAGCRCQPAGSALEHA